MLLMFLIEPADSMDLDDASATSNATNLSVGHMAGIKNLLNSCFMSAILQLYFHLCELSPAFQRAITDPGTEITAAFSDLLKKSKDTKIEVLDPTAFQAVINKHFPIFDNKQQHDADEFLLQTLDQILQPLRDTERRELVYFELTTTFQRDCHETTKSVLKPVLELQVLFSRVDAAEYCPLFVR
jgi:uncharacterized UBP type Zn finger protein